jgi:hypothetical protein
MEHVRNFTASGQKWVAGWNMPGYLPESGPTLFDDWTDARAHIVETIDRFWDDDAQSPDDHTPPMRNRTANDPITLCCERDAADCDCSQADRKWLEIHTQAGLATPNGSWLMADGNNSLVFWIVKAQDTEHNTAGGE